MTEEQKKLREAVARALYERSRNWFRDDPTTRGLGDDWEVFADQVFPPWKAIDDKTRYLEDADAAIAASRPFHRTEALQEAAKAADELEDLYATKWRAGMKCDTHLQGMSDGASETASRIRALIPSEARTGEKE